MLPPPKPTTASERSFALPDGCVETLHLMGAHGLSDFLTFARERADLSAMSTPINERMMELAESWRDAAGAYDDLQATDPYPAEAPTVFPIPAGMREHCDRLLTLPHVQREFDRVPIALAMVPLAQLVCARQHLTLGATHREVVAGGYPKDEALAALCLPLQPPPSGVTVVHQDASSITVMSDNPELRVLEAATPVSTGPADDSAFDVLPLRVGVPSGALNVLRHQDRLVLNGGFAQAFALYRRGVTHVPAVIQVCRHVDDLRLVGEPALTDHAAIYFERDRPPLLKDFADRRFAISLAVPSARKFVRVTYRAESGFFRA